MAFPIIPVALALAAGAFALSRAQKGKLAPVPASSFVQGKTYSLLFLSADTDPVSAAANLMQAGYAVVGGNLPTMQRTGVPVPMAGVGGGTLTEWLALATRVGPTVPGPDGGLQGFALLENGQVQL
jgi:hypothetical protein